MKRKQITSMLWGELELKLFYVYDGYSNNAMHIKTLVRRRPPFDLDIVL